MMMRMLEAGGIPVWIDGIRGPDEQNPYGYYELERVRELDKEGDKSWMRQGRGRAIKVVSSLLEHLPRTNNYRVLFIQRNLQEILVSQSKMLAARGESGGSASDSEMRRFYETHLTRIKHFLSHELGFECLEVHYAEVVRNPRAVAQEVKTFLRANLEIDAMVKVVDERLYRNRVNPHPSS